MASVSQIQWSASASRRVAVLGGLAQRGGVARLHPQRARHGADRAEGGQRQDREHGQRGSHRVCGSHMRSIVRSKAGGRRGARRRPLCRSGASSWAGRDGFLVRRDAARRGRPDCSCRARAGASRVKGLPRAEYFAIDASQARRTCLHYRARMRRVFTKTQGAMVDLNNSGIEGAATKPVLDAACMAELRALDPDGKAQLVKRVLATYQASLAKLVEQLRVGARRRRLGPGLARRPHAQVVVGQHRRAGAVGRCAPTSSACCAPATAPRRGAAARSVPCRGACASTRAVGQTLQHLEAAAS